LVPFNRVYIQNFSIGFGFIRKSLPAISIESLKFIKFKKKFFSSKLNLP